MFFNKFLVLACVFATLAVASSSDKHDSNDKHEINSKHTSKNSKNEKRCKCFIRFTGQTVSGDSKKVCDTLKDAWYDSYTQECVIADSNWLGPGTFTSACLAHTGYTNCNDKDRQLDRREVPDKTPAMVKRSIRESLKPVQKERRHELANCQCTNTIIGKVEDKKTQETCESIAGVKYDEDNKSCRISPANDLQISEFRYYCLLFATGSSC